MNDLIDFMLFDVTTRRLRKGLRSATTMAVVELQQGLDPDGNLSWVLGHYDNPQDLYVDRNGEVRKLPNSGIVPAPDLPPYE